TMPTDGTGTDEATGTDAATGTEDVTTDETAEDTKSTEATTPETDEAATDTEATEEESTDAPAAPEEVVEDTTETEAPAEAPAEEADTTVTLNVEISGAKLTYKAEDGTEQNVTPETDPKPVDVPNTIDFKFTVTPDEGQQVSSVSYGETVLNADDETGEYTVATADLTDGEKIVVTTEAVPAEETPAEEAPAEEAPAEPEVPAEGESTEAIEPTEDETTPDEEQATAEEEGATEPEVLSARRADNIVMQVGETRKVTCNQGSFRHNHSFRSSSSNVASVNNERDILGRVRSNQTVTAKAPGEATISCGSTVLLTVQVEARTAKVTFLPNGGTGDAFALQTSQVEDGQYRMALPDPADYGVSRDGYTFVGWSTDPSGNGQNYTPQEISVSDGQMFYAIWAKNNATGDVNAEYFIRIDGDIPFEPDANIGEGGKGYLPGGCTTGMKGTVEQRVAINNNLSLVAANVGDGAPSPETIQSAINAWNSSHPSQQVSFNPETQQVIWYVIKKCTDGNSGHEYHVDGIIVDKASYVLSYNPNRGMGNVPTGKSYREGDEVAVDFTRIPTRAGYEFLGWDVNRRAATPTYTEDGAQSLTMPDHDVTLYAIWQEKGAVKYTYKADPAAGGKVSKESESVRPDTGDAEGSTASANPGYEFDGWYNSEDVKITSENAASNNVKLEDDGTKLVPQRNTDGVYEGGTFTAKFVADDASIVFVENGGTGVEDLTGKTDQAIADTDMPTTARAGYDFDGWYTKDGTADGDWGDKVESLPGAFPAGVTTYYAKWTEDPEDKVDATYKVQYFKDGVESGEPETVNTKAWAGDPTKAEFVEGSVNTTNKFGDGWTFLKTEPAQIGETVTAGSTINVYYTADFSDFGIDTEGNTWTYDGSSRQIKVNGIYPGDVLTYDFGDSKVVTATVADDGTIEGEPNFKDVTDSATVKVTVTRGSETSDPAEATMTINPRTVVLTSGSDSKVYDGTALTNSDVIVTGDGFVQGEGVQYTFTGSQTAVGTSDNTFKCTLNANTLNVNYDIQLVEGTLTVTPQSITPGPDPDNPDPSYNDVTVDYPENVPYDGADHTWTPTVTDGDGNVLVANRDYTVSYSTTDRTNVTGTITVTITGTGNFAGTVTRTYQVVPRPLVVQANDQTKVQGAADPALSSGYNPAQLVAGEEPGWTGGLTREAGEAVGTYAITQGTLALEDNGDFLAANYVLTVLPGTLTITAAPAPDNPPATTDDGGDDTPTTPVGPTNPVPDDTLPVTDAADDATTDDATPEETVTDDENPLASGDEEGIEDNGNPLASGRGDEDCWVHWLILVGMILTAVYFVGVAVRRRKFTADLLDYEDKVLGNNRNDA
ncbi:MAG TPA: InlB B-repeat-containing protein, partial [Candidatus Olsenella avistercoris]|nr:InlB B-repeat-containing protein [Candidatus Olsenella avistercoris]